MQFCVKIFGHLAPLWLRLWFLASTRSAAHRQRSLRSRRAGRCYAGHCQWHRTVVGLQLPGFYSNSQYDKLAAGSRGSRHVPQFGGKFRANMMKNSGILLIFHTYIFRQNVSPKLVELYAYWSTEQHNSRPPIKWPINARLTTITVYTFSKAQL